MSNDSDNDEYEVGYGRPPRDTRFKKGRSGNPSGKRKGARSVRKQLEKFFGTPIAVTDSGKRKQLLPEVILMKKLFSLAAAGDVQAMRAFFAIRKQFTELDPVALEQSELDYSEAARKFNELAGGLD
jgi:hypothetical protein